MTGQASLSPNMASFQASDGLRLAYRVDDFTDPWRTPAIPILLLHPAMSNYRRWFAWLPILARQYICVTPELRGHGASEIPGEDRPLTLERLLADALELMDHLGIKRAHVVGNSAGGYIGQRMAIERPERVATLSLFAATPGLAGTQATGWVARIQKQGIESFIRETIADRFPPNKDAGFLDWFPRQMGGNDPAFIGRFVNHMSSREWSADLPRIQCPTLLVAPGAEPIGHHGQYEAMRDAIPRAELVTYEGMPHNIGDAVPKRCAEEVLRFLARQG
jgi:pimeloyl-ACP methyl ester carboxylesterase